MRREDNTQLARELNALAIKAVESTPPAFRAHAGVDILRGVERTLWVAAGERLSSRKTRRGLLLLAALLAAAAVLLIEPRRPR